jgi:Tfp pilus assembly protein PilO
MSVSSHWKTTKTVVAVVLALLLTTDVGLGIVLWRVSRQTPEDTRAEVDRLTLQAKLRRAELARGEKIRASLPQVGKDCDRFYQSAFLDKASGYSALESDLNAIADKAGLRIFDRNYKEEELKNRGVTEVTIATGVEGSYPAIIQFINGLEQSKNFYLLNNLDLASDRGGEIKLQLELRTYFRS